MSAVLRIREILWVIDGRTSHESFVDDLDHRVRESRVSRDSFAEPTGRIVDGIGRHLLFTEAGSGHLSVPSAGRLVALVVVVIVLLERAGDRVNDLVTGGARRIIGGRVRVETGLSGVKWTVAYFKNVCAEEEVENDPRTVSIAIRVRGGETIEEKR